MCLWFEAHPGTWWTDHSQCLHMISPHANQEWWRGEETEVWGVKDSPRNILPPLEAAADHTCIPRGRDARQHLTFQLLPLTGVKNGHGMSAGSLPEFPRACHLSGWIYKGWRELSSSSSSIFFNSADCRYMVWKNFRKVNHNCLSLKFTESRQVWRHIW